MRESKLLLSLKTLKKEELEGVRQLLNTDLLLKGSYKQECIRLFEYIMSYYDDLEHPNLERFFTLEEIFKGESSKINRLEKTMSNLLGVIDYYVVHFLSEQKFRIVRENMLLSKFYRKRGYNQRGKLLVKKNNEILIKSNEIIGVEYYNWLYLSEEEEMTVNEIEGRHYTATDYLVLIDIMDQYALLRKLEVFCRIVYKYKGFNDKTLYILEKVRLEINSNEQLRNNEVVQLYYFSLIMLQNYNNNTFDIIHEKYLKILQKNKQLLEFETNVLFAYLESICVTLRYNSEMSLSNLIKLNTTNRRHLNEKFLINDNRIGIVTALNLVTNSIKLKDYEWIKEFMEEWKDFIGYPSERSDSINLCWALFYFVKKEFTNAEKHIVNKYENIEYQIVSKRLRARINFETYEDTLLSYELDAFKVYIHRIYTKKIIDLDKYEANNNFVNRLRQIINLRNNPEFNAKERLLKKVTEQKCSEKEWLIDKIEEIKTPPPKKK